MVLSRHVVWNTGDPKWLGEFDTRIIQAVTLDGNDQDFELSVGNIALVYRLTVVTTATSWKVDLHGKTARAAADLIFSTGTQTVATFQEEQPVTYVDEGKGGILHLRVNGTSGQTLTVTLDMVRFP